MLGIQAMAPQAFNMTNLLDDLALSPRPESVQFSAELVSEC